MAARTNLDRLRDLARLTWDFGLNTQPIHFAWHLLYGNHADQRRLRFRLRSLGRRPIEARSGTSDLVVLFETFGASYDAPPAVLHGVEAKRIWDLGSNIGLTAARYACTFPQAHITGVELDKENAELARINTATYSPRCSILDGAVWFEDGEVDYDLEPYQEHGARVAEHPANGAHKRRARGWSLNSLLQDDAVVDYVKMDIEGAEALVLKHNTEWAAKVRVIKVECHTPYHPENARADLEALGFTTEIHSAHWASVIGYRR